MSESNNNIPVPIDPNSENEMVVAGKTANAAASNYLFVDYMQRRAKKTIETHRAGLLLWVEYLAQIGAGGNILEQAEHWALGRFTNEEIAAFEKYADSQACLIDLVYAAHFCQQSPESWRGVTWGLVEGFVKWLLSQGYSVSTVNNRLSVIKVYSRLATKAGSILPTEYALIREVRGYGVTEGKRVDKKRPYNRIGHKKEEAIVLSAEQARRLKYSHSPTPQGIRDQLLIILLLDLGLRASEVAALRVEDISESGHVTVYRQKTDTTDRMTLTSDLKDALRAYQPHQRAKGVLLRGSKKNGKLTENNMSVRAIGNRVKILGRDILGVWDLSPHDLRHTWATRAAQNSNPFALRDAGGWSNMQTPSRYVERSQVVNEGIQLDY